MIHAWKNFNQVARDAADYPRRYQPSLHPIEAATRCYGGGGGGQSQSSSQEVSVAAGGLGVVASGDINGNAITITTPDADAINAMAATAATAIGAEETTSGHALDVVNQVAQSAMAFNYQFEEIATQTEEEALAIAANALPQTTAAQTEIEQGTSPVAGAVPLASIAASTGSSSRPALIMIAVIGIGALLYFSLKK